MKFNYVSDLKSCMWYVRTEMVHLLILSETYHVSNLPNCLRCRSRYNSFCVESETQPYTVDLNYTPEEAQPMSYT